MESQLSGDLKIELKRKLKGDGDGVFSEKAQKNL
jgi:hypothetical protein